MYFKYKAWGVSLFIQSKTYKIDLNKIKYEIRQFHAVKGINVDFYRNLVMEFIPSNLHHII